MTGIGQRINQIGWLYWVGNKLSRSAPDKRIVDSMDLALFINPILELC